MVNIAILVTVIPVSAFILIWFIFYIVHILMVTTEYDTARYAFGTWKSFMLCYNNRTWHRVGESLYCNIDDSHIGHSCICFGGCGMILDPISFLRYGLWVYKTIRVTRHATKHEWK